MIVVGANSSPMFSAEGFRDQKIAIPSYKPIWGYTTEDVLAAISSVRRGDDPAVLVMPAGIKLNRDLVVDERFVHHMPGESGHLVADIL